MKIIDVIFFVFSSPLKEERMSFSVLYRQSYSFFYRDEHLKHIFSDILPFRKENLISAIINEKLESAPKHEKD